MHCYIIHTGAEVIEGAEEFVSLGYTFEAFPSVQNPDEITSLVKDTDAPTANFLPKPLHDYTARKHAKSLKATFIKLLSSIENDKVLFCESDCIPGIVADKLLKALEQDIQAFPDTDVYRLFLEHPSPSKASEASFKDWYIQPGNSVLNASVFGTHALYIPTKSRKKVANILSTLSLATDTALEYACQQGRLKVRTATANIFWQKKRYKRIAVCLTSYNRPVDLQRQLYAIMDQDYPEEYYKVFACVKGLSEFYYKNFIYPNFKHFEEEGRLRIYTASNKNLLSNFLDTIRDVDLSDYDLFLKVDDDDFYSRDYLKSVDEFHSAINYGHSSTTGGLMWALDKSNDIFVPYATMFPVCGATWALTPEVIRELRGLEYNEKEKEKIKARNHAADFLTEDALMAFVASNKGVAMRHSGVYSDIKENPPILINRTTKSVMRGDLTQKIIRPGIDVCSNEFDENVIQVLYKESKVIDLIRLVSGTASSKVTNRSGKYFAKSDAITINWSDGTTESFHMDTNGMYVFLSTPHTPA